MLIDEPQYVDRSDYFAAQERMVEKLISIEGILCIYQIGSVRHPGISDLDIVVVFEDGVIVSGDMRAALSETDAYLYSHKLFGMNKSMFLESKNYTFFHNFKLLWGKEISDDISFYGNENELVIIQHQWARSFLLRMYLNLLMQNEYRVYKVHSLLLNCRALIYDLEFLGESPEQFMDLLDKLMHWRESWFLSRPDNAEIIIFVETLTRVLTDFINRDFNTNKFYLPKRKEYCLGRNIYLKQSNMLRGRGRGVKLILPNFLMNKKSLSLLNRFNQFEVMVPFTNKDIPPIINRSFEYTERAWRHNSQHLPHFMPLASNLVFSS